MEDCPVDARQGDALRRGHHGVRVCGRGRGPGSFQGRHGGIGSIARACRAAPAATKQVSLACDLTTRAGFGVDAVTTEYASNGMPLSLVLMGVDNPVDSR